MRSMNSLFLISDIQTPKVSFSKLHNHFSWYRSIRHRCGCIISSPISVDTSEKMMTLIIYCEHHLKRLFLQSTVTESAAFVSIKNTQLPSHNIWEYNTTPCCWMSPIKVICCDHQILNSHCYVVSTWSAEHEEQCRLFHGKRPRTENVIKTITNSPDFTLKSKISWNCPFRTSYNSNSVTLRNIWNITELFRTGSLSGNIDEVTN